MTTPIGKVNVSDDVVSTIAGLAAAQIVGVAGTSESLASGIAKILRQSDSSKGVKVSIGEKNDVVIDISVVIEMGHPIPSVSSQLQRAIKDEVEKMTGLDVVAVNVHVTGLSEKKQKEEVPEAKPAKKKKSETKAIESAESQD